MSIINKFLSRRVYLLALAAALCFLLSSSILKGQSALDSIGIPKASPTFPIEHGVINLANGNVHLEIPLENYTQRGDIKLPATLVYDSTMWKNTDPCGSSCPQWQPTASNLSTSGGWYLQYGNGSIVSDSVTFPCFYSAGNGAYIGTNGNAYIGKDIRYYDRHNTLHVFPNPVVHLSSDCQFVEISNTPAGFTMDTPPADLATASAYATDGSGLYATISNYYDIRIFDSQGVEVANNVTNEPSMIDRNGNYISADSSSTVWLLGQSGTPGSNFKDTLNRTLITATESSDDKTEYIDVPLAQGGTARYTINFKGIAIQTAFRLKGVQEYSGGMDVIDSLVLPDGTSYRFGYEEGSYGELNSMTLPHGGAVSFTYQTSSTKTAISSYNVPSRWVASHTGSDGTTSFNWINEGATQIFDGGAPGIPGGAKFCDLITNTVTNQSSKHVYTLTRCSDAIQVRMVEHGSTNSNNPDVIELYDYDFTNLCPTIKPFQDQQAFNVCNGYQWANLIAKTVVLPVSGRQGPTTDTRYSYDTPGSGIPTSMRQWDYYNSTVTYLPNTPQGTPTREVDQKLGWTVNNALFPTEVKHLDSTGALVSSATYKYDEPGYLSSSPETVPSHDNNYVTGNRGNLTTIEKCCAQDGSKFQIHFYYDDAGAITATKDGNGNTTIISYDSTDTFAQVITAPSTDSNLGSVSHIIQKNYDPNSGQLLSSTDQNNQTTTYNYDEYGRPYSVQYSNGGSPVTLQVTSYPSLNETDVSILQSLSTGALSTSQIVDFFGRAIQAIGGDVSTETSYDLQGHVSSVSNTHSSSPASTDGATYYGYDNLGRIQSVTMPGGGVTTYSYLGNTVTITDPLQHSRQMTFDAFGDITAVAEPDSTKTLSLITAYQYNGLGLLTQINQKGGTTDQSQWRTRTFSYDGLGRLISQGSPEAGTVNYAYDGNGNLIKSQNQNSTNNTTLYTYDSNNRLLTKSVGGGPTYTYTYDAKDGSGDKYGIGKLTSTSNGSNVQTMYTHDALGRAVSASYCLPSDCSFSYQVQSAYDFQGNLTSLTYPDGRQITWSYDQLNRPTDETYTQWNSTPVNTPLASNLSYYPGGQLQQATFGNGVQVGATYDVNQNVSSLAYLVGGAPVVQKTYTWDLNAQNLLSVNDSASGRTQSYAYDQLDRLSSMNDTGSTANACVTNLPGIPPASQSFSFDAWGNLKQSGTWSFTENVDSSNRIFSTGYNYDSAGNLLADGAGNNYQYRSDGLISSSNGSTYTYDAFGQRVRKDGSSATEYVYFGGQLLAMRDSSTGAWLDRIYGPTGVLATIAGTQAAVPSYRIGDHLGSLTHTMDNSGGITGAANVLPYGQLTTNTTGDNFLFTDHERDVESGTDATLFRHFSPAQGRWLSPDPYNGSYDLTDPQSLNRYAYLSNRPMAGIDSLGLDDDCCDFSAYLDYYGDSGWSDGGWWGGGSSSIDWNWSGGGSFSSSLDWGGGGSGPSGGSSSGPWFGGSGTTANASNDSSGSGSGCSQSILARWLCFWSPVDHASDWMDNHPLANLPLLGLAFIGGNGERALDILQEEGGVLEEKASAYSVAFETTIRNTGIGERAAHFVEANNALNSTMENDAEFADAMENLGVKVGRLDKSPSGWTWHHVFDQPGVMQLVPTRQHQWGSIWQSLLHPNGKGGFSNWGRFF